VDASDSEQDADGWCYSATVSTAGRVGRGEEESTMDRPVDSGPGRSTTKRKGESDMTTTDRRAEETQVRRRIESWTKALRAKDLEGVWSHYAPDILVFDLAPPLEHQGAAYKHSLAEWFRTFEGPIGFEMRDLSITTGDGIAFSRSLNRITGRRTNGETTDVWVRATVCFRKLDGEWLVVHEHASVPFYMDGSFRAAVDLKPNP
jgi:ketosteroid isomerase-like protein